MNNEQKKIETTFALERRFPDVKKIFTVYEELDTQSDNVIYVLDTNVLLLPYKNANIGAKQMEEIKSILTDLKNDNKLYIPERVIREFASNHGEKISNLISHLNNNKSLINFPIIEFPKILQDHELFNELNVKGQEIKEKIQDYKKDYKKLVEDIKAWKGNDPIKAIYNDLFDQDNIEPCPDSEEDLIKEWEVRLLTKRPPGYKDQGKDDSGIGDFIIWKTIIGLAKKYNKDIIFVTGEQKNDWFVRGNNEALFMRPELSNEFSDLTNGKKIALESFDSMLSFYEASDNLIEEIVQAEKNVNINQFSNFINPYNNFQLKTAGFDYSTNNGYITLTDNRKNLSFKIKFSKASDNTIHIYSDGLAYIGRIKDKPPLSQLNISEYDTSSRAYTIKTGEAFFAVDHAGNVLSGRIKDIKDDNRNDINDYVSFVYEIFSPNENMFIC